MKAIGAAWAMVTSLLSGLGFWAQLEEGSGTGAPIPLPCRAGCNPPPSSVLFNLCFCKCKCRDTGERGVWEHSNWWVRSRIAWFGSSGEVAMNVMSPQAWVKNLFNDTC